MQKPYLANLCLRREDINEQFWRTKLNHLTSFALAQFGSLLLTTSTGLLLGFPNHCIPHSTEQMQTGRQIHRWVKTDRQTGGINPWLWSRKQCQMLLIMSTYNHFVRHASLRTSKYILYTRVKSVALTCSQTSHRVKCTGHD